MTQSNTPHYREQHPDWYHNIPIMHTLILGSFPPHENKRDYPFYYPYKQNNFWKILSAIAGKPLHYWSGEDAVAERKAPLRIARLLGAS